MSEASEFIDPAVTTDIIIGNSIRPPHEMMHDAWGDVFMQNHDGTFMLDTADALAVVHQTFQAIRATGVSVSGATQAEQGGFISARLVPELLEVEVGIIE